MNLEKNRETRIFSVDESIPLQPESIWLLQKGIVKTTTWNSDNTVICLGYWGAGDVLGQPLSKAKPYHIKCITDVEAICIPLANKNFVLEHIFAYVQQLEQFLCIIRIEKVSDRLYKVLCWLADKFGREIDRGIILDLSITHQELAELVGATRQTVTKIINQFEEEETVIRLRNPRRVLIPNSKLIQ